MKALRAGAFAAVLSLVACVPAYRVTPVGDSLLWSQGRQFVVQRQAGVEVWAAVGEGFVSNALMFDVVVENQGAADTLIDAQAFCVVGPAVQLQGCGEDPELRLAALQDERRRLEPDSLLDGLIEITDSLASFGDDTPEKRQARQQERDHREEERRVREAKLHAVQREIRVVETTFLRKTTLRPGERIQGRVNVRAQFQAGDLNLTLSSLGAPVSLPFAVRE